MNTRSLDTALNNTSVFQIGTTSLGKIFPKATKNSTFLVNS